MNDASQGVGEEVQPKTAPMNGDDRLPDSFWATSNREFDDFPGQGERFNGEVYPKLVSLSHIQAAIRRKFGMWFTLALIGFIVGVGLYVVRPAGYEASTSLYLTQPPNSVQGWIADDQAIAQSRTVAGMALRSLGLGRESVAAFVTTYTVVPLTDRVLVITLKAPSQADALRKANAVAVAFLTFQARLLTEQEKLDNAALEQQVSAATKQLAGIKKQLAALAPSSPEQRVLTGQRARASAELTQLKLAVGAAKTAAEAATTLTIKNSVVLDAAALAKVSRKRLLLFVGGGLLGGLVLGLGIVVINAIVSTRLRRRDELARALGAPVRLSIGKVRPQGRALLRRGLAATRDPNLSRLVSYLGGAVTRSPGAFAGLAVVPVDEKPAGSVEVAAVCLASLAALSAQQGLRVVLADLHRGAPAAGLLGVSNPGVDEVTVEGSTLVVMVPDSKDAMPAGPPQRPSHEGAGERATAAFQSADVVLTLAELDPGLGGDYLAGWTRNVVAVVTAGRSSAERIQAVGEMVRLAGIARLSAVLIGADKTDESVGLTGTQPLGSDRPTGQITAAELGLWPSQRSSSAALILFYYLIGSNVL